MAASNCDFSWWDGVVGRWLDLFSFSFLFLVFGLAREEEESGNIFENRSWNCVLFLFFFLFLLIKVSKVISNFSKIKIKMQWKLELNGIMLFFEEETAVRDPRHADLDKSFHPSRVGTSRRPC